MSHDGIAALAQALLYEGYLLYPYRASSVKNSHRWMLGTLYPRAFAEDQRENDPWFMQAQCLVHRESDAEIDAHVRFLHLTEQPRERQVHLAYRLSRLCEAPQSVPFAFEADNAELHGVVDIAAVPAGDRVVKVTLCVRNVTPFTVQAAGPAASRRDGALRSAFVSAHAVLGVRDGEFVSLLDPPASLREVADSCIHVGVWPVLVGSPGTRDTMLAAPIILEDYPRVAPESSGDFFDATEIDELLTSRVLTLTDEEKAAVRSGDPRARELLERTEALSEGERRGLYGAQRTFRPGMRVRIAPYPGGDVLDLALAGRVATVVSLEEDVDGRHFVAVTVDDDPGRDLGTAGWPGHRFFFRPDELEPLT